MSIPSPVPPPVLQVSLAVYPVSRPVLQISLDVYPVSCPGVEKMENGKPWDECLKNCVAMGNSAHQCHAMCSSRGKWSFLIDPIISKYYFLWLCLNIMTSEKQI